MEEDNKFGTGEILIFSLLFLFVDLICFLLDWTVVAAFFTPVIQGFILFFMDKMFINKGSKTASKLGKKIAKYALQLVPILPTLFGTFLVEALIHNNPKLVHTVAKAASFAPGPVGAAAKIAVKSGVL